MSSEKAVVPAAALCRRLAEATLRLATQTDHADIADDFRALAGKLMACAERADAGDPDPWRS